MAKNWLMGEAAEAIKSDDKAAIKDIGTRFPIVANLLAQINEPAVEICKALPDYATVRSIESRLKDGVEAVEDDGDETEKVEKSEKKPAAAKKGVNPDSKYAGMSWDDIYALIKKRKIKTSGTSKSVMIAALEKWDAENDGEDDEDEKPAKKSAKSASKKSAKKQVEEDDDEDDDDDEDEEEDVKPAKKSSKKAPAKKAVPAKKSSKKVEEDDDDDDDDEDFDFDDDDDDE